VYIKYHFLAKHGQKQLTEPEAIRISGENPDYSKMQLWDAIEVSHVSLAREIYADSSTLFTCRLDRRSSGLRRCRS
jgi:hypothetical protein